MVYSMEYVCIVMSPRIFFFFNKVHLVLLFCIVIVIFFRYKLLQSFADLLLAWIFSFK